MIDNVEEAKQHGTLLSAQRKEGRRPPSILARTIVVDLGLFYTEGVENNVLLQLGRLDGRLANSPARAIWTVRMQLRAIALASVAAGVPVDVIDIERWFAAGDDMPRRREGLNDPFRLSTIAHLTLAASAAAKSDAEQAAARKLGSLFDHRAVALEVAPEELVALTPVWRNVHALASRSGRPRWPAAAERCAQLVEAAEVDFSRTLTVSDPCERRLHFINSRPTSWLAAIAVPLALKRLGLTQTLVPNFVPSLRVLHHQAQREDALAAFILRESTLAMAELDPRELGR